MHFYEYQDEFGCEQPRKMRAFPIEKIYNRRWALQEFNKENNTTYWIIDYLHQSSLRGSYIKASTFPKVQKNIELLYSIWFTQSGVEKRLLLPWIERYFNYAIERNQKYIAFFKEQLQRDDSEIKNFLMRYPMIFTVNIDLIRKKAQHLISSWYSTREDIKKICMWYPRFYTHSTERVSWTIDTLKSIATPDLLLKYPVLLYFNPYSDFFKRVVKWAHKNHKRYLTIIERMNLFHSNQVHMYDKIIPWTWREPRTNQAYLQDLQTGIYKSDYYFTTLEEKKELVFERCKQYLWGGEIEFLSKIFDKQNEWWKIIPQEREVFKLVMQKIINDSQLYNDIRNIFEYKKEYLPF